MTKLTPEDAEMRQNRFYEHLDKCKQCREHPMELCAEGARLLQQAATEDELGDLAAR
jgi:predicted anti-sigma-YlaC factor YlaD